MTQVDDCLVARACVSLIHCARGHPVSRLARELVNKSWALSIANGSVSDRAFSSILVAVTGESAEANEDATIDNEDDVSEVELLCSAQCQSASQEDEEDVLLEGNALAEYLEQEATHHDRERELLSARNASRKAGQTADRVADLVLRLRALDLLERCVGVGQPPPGNFRGLRALGPLTRLAMALDEGPDCPEASDLALRVANLISGKLGGHIIRLDLARTDMAAAAVDLLDDLLDGLRCAPRGRGYFETVPTCVHRRILRLPTVNVLLPSRG